MAATLSIADLSDEQRALWQRVTELWAWSQSRDQAGIRSALHADYVGWDMNTLLPHDREAAVGSVSGESPQLADYLLEPLSVKVYDDRVGVAHYRYAATILPQAARPTKVSGCWTEVYLKQGDSWTMVAVSGRPDPQQGSADLGSTAA